MSDRVLKTTLLPKKERIFPALVEMSPLENSFKEFGKLNFPYFPVKHSILSFRKALAGRFVPRKSENLLQPERTSGCEPAWLLNHTKNVNRKLNAFNVTRGIL